MCWRRPLLALLVFALFAPAAQAAPGDLDPSFGTGGRAVLTPGGRETAYTDVAIQPDGKILLAGYSRAPAGDNDMAVTRLNPDGSPDMGFGTDGTAFVSLLANPITRSEDLAFGLALQPNGRILVAGSSTSPTAVTVARLLPGGGPDTGFAVGGTDGVDGVWRGPIGTAFDVGVAPDGKIVTAGLWTPFTQTQTNYRTERLNSDGTPDNGYGGDTETITGDLGGDDGLNRLAILPDGKVLAAGFLTSTDADAMVARIAPGTGLDTGFGAGGRRVISGAGSDDAAQDLLVEPGGKIDVAGYSGDNFTLTRLTAGGDLDPSLDGKPTVQADFGADDTAYAIALLANGKIVLGGTSGPNFAVARFQPGGVLDASFGSGGKRTIDFPGTVGTANAMAVQPDGKIVLAGFVGTGAASGAVVRLVGDTAGEGGGGVGGGGKKPKVYRCAGKRATIVGTNKKNKLRGTRRADVIVGLGGNDTISGLGGNDVVCAGSGNDKVSGGKGNDREYGGSGNDKLSGDGGNDKIAGEAGKDSVSGGSGNDSASGGSGNDKVAGGSGKDKLNGNGGKDLLNGGGGKDKCAGRDRKKAC